MANTRDGKLRSIRGSYYGRRSGTSHEQTTNGLKTTHDPNLPQTVQSFDNDVLQHMRLPGSDPPTPLPGASPATSTQERPGVMPQHKGHSDVSSSEGEMPQTRQCVYGEVAVLSSETQLNLQPQSQEHRDHTTEPAMRDRQDAHDRSHESSTTQNAWLKNDICAIPNSHQVNDSSPRCTPDSEKTVEDSSLYLPAAKQDAVIPASSSNENVELPEPTPSGSDSRHIVDTESELPQGSTTKQGEQNKRKRSDATDAESTPAKRLSKAKTVNPSFPIRGVERPAPTELYEIIYNTPPKVDTGYFIQKTSSAAPDVPEWTETRRLKQFTDGRSFYSFDDIIFVNLEPPRDGPSSNILALGRILDIRTIDYRNDELDSDVVFLIAWFNTKQDARLYRDDWGCKKISEWPRTKKYVLTTRLQLIEPSMASKPSVMGLERTIALHVVHDIVSSRRIVPFDEVKERFVEARMTGLPRRGRITEQKILAELNGLKKKVRDLEQICDGQAKRIETLEKRGSLDEA